MSVEVLLTIIVSALIVALLLTIERHRKTVDSLLDRIMEARGLGPVTMNYPPQEHLERISDAVPKQVNKLSFPVRDPEPAGMTTIPIEEEKRA